MDDKEAKRLQLLELAKANGLDVHHKSGIAKLQEALIEAGVSFESYNDDSAEQAEPVAEDVLGAKPVDSATTKLQDEIEDLRDELTAAEAVAKSADDPIVTALREQLAAKVENMDKRAARAKVAAVQASEKVQCVALKKFHVQKTDLGLRDHHGQSIEVSVGQKMMLAEGLAKSLEARGQVAML